MTGLGQFTLLTSSAKPPPCIFYSFILHVFLQISCQVPTIPTTAIHPDRYGIAALSDLFESCHSSDRRSSHWFEGNDISTGPKDTYADSTGVRLRIHYIYHIFTYSRWAGKRWYSYIWVGNSSLNASQGVWSDGVEQFAYIVQFSWPPRISRDYKKKI